MQTKWLAKSKTLWGAVIMALPVIAQSLGYDMTPEGAATIGSSGVAFLDAAFELVGALVVVWGRMAAGTKATLLPQPGGTTVSSPALAGIAAALLSLVLLAACDTSNTRPRDARDALAITEFSVQGVTDTARAAVAAGLIRGDDAVTALDQVRTLRQALGVARTAVELNAPDAEVQVQALNAIILGLSTFLETRGVTAQGLPPPQSRSLAPGAAPEPPGQPILFFTLLSEVRHARA